MMQIRVSAATLNQTPLHWERNINNILSAIQQAKQQNVALLCLPEMSITGYGCEDAFLSPSTQATALEILEEVACQCQNIAVAVGLPVNFNNALYNCVALIVNGEIKGIVAKQYLAGEGIHYEPRWFKPWQPGVHDIFQLNDQKIAFGDLLFSIDGILVGFEICEDAWVATRPGIQHAQQGVDILLNPSASHFSFGKHETRKSFVREGSRAFAATYVYTNLVGNEAGRIVYDGGSMITSAGKMIAAGKRFSFKMVDLLIADVDIEYTRMQKTQRPSITTKGNAQIVECKCDFLTERPDVLSPQTIEDSSTEKADEFSHAVALGLFDYMSKSYSKGFVLSLSGGADSGAVAVLIKIMVDLAIKELGIHKFKERLNYISLCGTTSLEIVNELLTCVYQATRNSSDTTLEAAQALSTAIGAQFYNWEVDDMVQSYTSLIEHSLNRPLTWREDDLALQNIQARVRAPGVWMLANVKGTLLLSTSNRSEAAVGYATMDGDTSGGLSPIAGIDKAYLLTWLNIIETQGIKNIAPIGALRAINAQQPTAELRPKENTQTDENDLMPYPILEAIEKLAIRDRKNPIQIYRNLKAKTDIEASVLKEWISRFFTLWSRNQWKRERYAPSFHLDDENLDPKTWCRFPILSGGFRRELKQLKNFPE